jgi:hypothetical protein
VVTPDQYRVVFDPMLDRTTLGFAVAAVFLTAWWNLQPTRFMRFWLKPPYKPLTVTLFRVFFAANLIGAVSYFTEEMKRYQRPIYQYRAAAEVAVAWIAVIWVMVTAMLWLARRRDQTNRP